VQYLVRINKDAGSDWGASVPDLPGCVGQERRSILRYAGFRQRSSSTFRGLKADGVRPPRPRQRAVFPRRSARRIDFYASVEVAA
jgi:hypothetical protein